MFTIADGRNFLYRWDTNVRLLLDDPDNTIGEVTIKQRFCKGVYSLEIFRDENETYVKIPDSLLQKSYDLILYAYCYVDNCTKSEETIEVRDRPKPPDYVYEEDEVLHYNLFEKRLAALEQAGGITDAQLESVIESYFVNNPIESPAVIGTVELFADKWVIDKNNLCSQVVDIAGVTENSQVDLTPSVDQLVIFYEKDLAFVTENDGGIVTVYAIGQKPENDYTIQVTITEVVV